MHLKIITDMQRNQALPHSPPVSSPCCLYRASSPCLPLWGMEPENVLKFLAVKPPKLISKKFEILCSQCKSFYFDNSFHGSSGRRQVVGRSLMQCPLKQFLAAEVARI
ncbi:hypothetical protein AKJ16_DCAP00812 [Drosera capensis]